MSSSCAQSFIPPSTYNQTFRFYAPPIQLYPKVVNQDRENTLKSCEDSFRPKKLRDSHQPSNLFSAYWVSLCCFPQLQLTYSTIFLQFVQQCIQYTSSYSIRRNNRSIPLWTTPTYILPNILVHLTNNVLLWKYFFHNPFPAHPTSFILTKTVPNLGCQSLTWSPHIYTLPQLNAPKRTTMHRQSNPRLKPYCPNDWSPISFSPINRHRIQDWSVGMNPGCFWFCQSIWAAAPVCNQYSQGSNHK